MCGGTRETEETATAAAVTAAAVVLADQLRGGRQISGVRAGAAMKTAAATVVAAAGGTSSIPPPPSLHLTLSESTLRLAASIIRFLLSFLLALSSSSFFLSVCFGF